MNQKNLEINFQRLVAKTTELAEQKDERPDWRLEKYVQNLDEILKQLNKLTVNKPSNDALKDYGRRIEFLRQLSNIKNKKNFLSTKQQHEPSLKLSNPSALMTTKDVKQKQIYHQTFLNQETVLRDQLFSKSSTKILEKEEKELQELIREEQEYQEKVANEMLKSVSSIKENSLLARKIIKSDMENLENLSTNASSNSENLKSVNENLTERVSRSCNCWIWLMILLIFIIFVMMVLFMKLFPKQKYSSYISSEYETSTTTVYNHYTDKTIE
ncbi:Vesicle transport USE1, partial [Brachionus plicatilis]